MNLFRPFRLSVLIACLGAAFQVFAEAPENDLFANRIAVSGDDFELFGNVAEAGVEPDEPASGMEDYRSLWWTWSTNRNGYLIPSYETGITVFHGDTLSELAIAPVESATVDGNLFNYVPVEAGISQVIRVAGWRTNCFRPAFISPPINPRPPVIITNRCWVIGPDVRVRYRFIPDAGDLFADRIPAEGTAPEFFSPPGNLPPEASEPVYPDLSGNSRWWSWTAPVTARYGLVAPFNGMSIFRGDAPTNLVLAAHGTRSTDEVIIHVGGSYSRLVTFTAHAGEAFAVRVDALADTTNNAWFSGRLKALERPANDDFSEAFTYSTASNAPIASVDLFGATEQPDEPAGLNRSVWWRWTPERSGVRVLARSSDPTRDQGEDLRFTVFSGTTITGLVRRAVLEPAGRRVAFTVSEGETIYIAADQPAGVPTFGAGAFTVVEAAANDSFAGAIPIVPGQDLGIIPLAGTSFEEGETVYGGGSVWYHCTAPADGKFFVQVGNAYARIWSGSALTNLVLHPLAAQVGTLTAIPVTNGERLWVSIHPAAYYFAGARLWLDFSTARLLRPAGNFVADAGVSQIEAEIVPAISETEAPPIGIRWVLTPANFRSVFSPPVIRGNSATWQNVPSDVWRLQIWITNSFGRALPVDEATVRLRPQNDDFGGGVAINAIPYSSLPVRAIGAGVEIGEPSSAYNEALTNSLWWHWTADVGAEMVAVGESVEVFTGDRLDNLRRLQSTYPGVVRFGAFPGVRYNFRIRPADGLFGLQTTFRLDRKLAGDDFGDRIPLSQQGGQFLVPSGLATAESDEPPYGSPAAFSSLWWTWTAPANGTVVVTSRSLFTEGYVPGAWWRAFSGGVWPALDEVTRLPFVLPSQVEHSALWQVRTGQSLELSAAWQSPDVHPEIARLEFLPDPPAGSAGAVFRMRDPGAFEGIAFPITGNAGDKIVIEKSDDLGNWNDFETHDFPSESTFWFHSFTTPAYFRIRWERIRP